MMHEIHCLQALTIVTASGESDWGPLGSQLHPKVLGCCPCASVGGLAAGDTARWRCPMPVLRAQLPLVTGCPAHPPLRCTRRRTSRWTGLGSFPSASAADRATVQRPAGRSWAWQRCAAPPVALRPDTLMQTGLRLKTGCRRARAGRRGRTPSGPAASLRTWRTRCPCLQTPWESSALARIQRWRREIWWHSASWPDESGFCFPVQVLSSEPDASHNPAWHRRGRSTIVSQETEDPVTMKVWINFTWVAHISAIHTSAKYPFHVEPQCDENGHTGDLLPHEACFPCHGPVAVLSDANVMSQLLQEALVHVVIRERLTLP